MPPEPTAIDLKKNGVVLIGRLGWLFWQLRPDLDVRLAVADSGHGLHVWSVVIGSANIDEPLTRASLRDLPLGVIQRALTGGPLPDGIRSVWDQEDAPDLRPGRCDAATAQTILATAVRQTTTDATLVIEIPDDRRRDDSFYRQVELTYSLAVARGASSAASDIAKANGVEVSTVYRWLKEGRRRSATKAKNRRLNPPKDRLWPDEPDPQLSLGLDPDEAPEP